VCIRVYINWRETTKKQTQGKMGEREKGKLERDNKKANTGTITV
jgi:hypothetical protein